MKWEKGKGMKRAIDGNINIGGMKGDKSLAIDAKKEENGNVVVWRKRGKKNKNMNEDNYVELREGRRDRDDDEKEVQEGKDNLNTVKDQREDVQPDEDAELSSSGTESEEPDQDDGNYNHHITHQCIVSPDYYCSFAPWNLTVFTLDQK